ncbi:helix-turn-helix transcriptional regulator [Haloferax sp. YSSS75]|uniref:helix-turn-helix transcriptional regulator n=1 Tax=Haloferax sp. YSSS75 TaxID=3388564 RepID=UPI00398D06F0
MNAREDVAFLVGSQSRVSILRALADGPHRPTELARCCGCARETAQRTLAGFRDRGWVQKSDGLYRLTPVGELIFEQYDQLVDTVECTDRMSEFLTNAGGLYNDVPTDVLQELNVTTAANNDPHAPINRYLTILGDEPVDRFRGVSPIVSRVFNEAAEQVIGPQTEMELVIDRDVLERSMSEYSDAFELGRELDQFSLYVVDDELEYGLTLVDGHGVVMSHDEYGNVLALVDGDTPEVVAWVEELYESRRADASPVDYDEPAT